MINDLDHRYDRLRDLGYDDEQMARLSSRSADEILFRGSPPQHWDNWEDDDRLIEIAAPRRAAPEANGHAPGTNVKPEVAEPPVEILPLPLQPAQVPPLSDDGFSAQIRAEMRDYGIEQPPDHVIADSRWHRFAPTPGRKGRSGTYKIIPDPVAPVWWFRDWRLGGEMQRGKGKPSRKLTAEETAAWNARIEEAQRWIAHELAEFREAEAMRARERWETAKPAPTNHEYLRRKRVKANGLKIEDGCLLVPLRDIAGKMWSVLKIFPDGLKLNQEFARASECFYTIGDISSGDTFCIAEGYATAATIYEATGFPTISACYAGNLEKVAPLLRKQYPDATIYVCGDDDFATTVDGKPHNTGKIAATNAAKAIGGILVLPQFGSARAKTDTDFNDQYLRFGGLDKNGREDGLASVKETLRLARAAYEEEEERERDAEPPPAAGATQGDPPPASSPEDPGDEEADDTDTDDSISGDADTEALKATRQEIKEKLNAAIDKMNKKYCVVSDSGSVFIFSDRYERELGRRIYDRMTKTGFMMLLESKPPICTSISAEGKRSAKPIAKVWLTSRHRRTYDEVVFDPTTTESRDGKLNLWRGFEFNPKPGTWNRLKEHICNIICTTDPECLRYLMKWMARAVQFPAQQGEVAVVLRGGKGVGKGILGHILRKLFGQHGMYISQSKHLVGAFNAHLRDCVFLFADEAFFAGDKSSEGVLKSLITEDVITIEPKGQNAILCKNRLHTLMASNEKWVVPASLDERRFLILDVSNAHYGDYPYFDKIKTEMEAGGYEAMLHDLRNYDISDFNVRRVPGTAALDDQKKRSLLHELQWWHDVLARGYVYRSKHGLEAYFGQWHEWVSTDVLFDSYQDFAKSRNVRHAMARALFGKFMNDMGCKPVRPRGNGGVTGEHLVRSDYNGALRAETITKDRPPGYHLGTLEVARQAFEAHTKLPFDWDAEEETAEAALAEPHDPQEQP